MTHTSASDKANISSPLLSPLFVSSSSKGSMRMTIFRPGVRFFSTFSISNVAFWGVSQMTTEISAKNKNQVRGHNIFCQTDDFFAKGRGDSLKVKPSRSPVEINLVISANKIYRVQAYSINYKKRKRRK